jgi:hypothetical protein
LPSGRTPEDGRRTSAVVLAAGLIDGDPGYNWNGLVV